jgi:hypothetical protein
MLVGLMVCSQCWSTPHARTDALFNALKTAGWMTLGALIMVMFYSSGWFRSGAPLSDAMTGRSGLSPI